MKPLIVGVCLLFLTVGASAQQQQAAPPSAPPQAGQACLTQYTPLPGRSAFAMINAGYEIKAAIPNGLWLQKDREVLYCHSGRPIETDALCWRLRELSTC